MIDYLGTAIPTISFRCTNPPWATPICSSSAPAETVTKEQLLARIKQLESQNKKLRKENVDLRAAKNNSDLKHKMNAAKIAKLKAAAAANKLNIKQFQNVKISKAGAKQIVTEALSPYFSTAQINWFLNKNTNNKHGYNWSKEDLTIALTIMTLSKQTFNYIRKKRLIPLPSISTIRNHFKSFVVKEGHLEHVHQLLTLMGLNMSAKERIVMICFDEVSVKAEISYDSTHDRFVGPHSEVNVMMVRGVYSNFKIPIYFEFDKALNKDNMEMGIKAVESAGFHVIAICSDMGTKNKAVKDELGVTVEEPWFKHPCTETRPNSYIYYLHDVPHLLKLLRNHLLSKGFVLKNGTTFGKKELEKLFEKLLTTELNPAPKLSPAHIHVSGQDKQKVFLATQLLSQTTANCISKFFPGDTTMQEMSQFISDVNTVFDIFNSKTELHKSNPLGNAYGLNKEDQDVALTSFYRTIFGLRVVWDSEQGHKQAKLPWQDGFLQSINALQVLYDELQRDYDDIDCLFTYKLNQDCLETTFSVIRSMGYLYKGFGALEFIRRIRRYILGAGADLSIEAANVEPTEQNDFKIAALIDKDMEVEVSVDKCIELNVDAKEAPDNIPDNFDVQMKDPVQENADDEMEIEGQQDGLEKLVTEVEVFNLSGFVNESISELQGLSKESILSDFKSMEKHFETFHSQSADGLVRTPNVIKDLVNTLKLLFPLYPERIIKKFVFKRSMLKMKFIYRTKIKHKQSLRSQIKVIEFVHSKAADELKKTASKKAKKTVKRLKESKQTKKKAAPKKQPTKKQSTKKQQPVKKQSINKKPARKQPLRKTKK